MLHAEPSHPGEPAWAFAFPFKGTFGSPLPVADEYVRTSAWRMYPFTYQVSLRIWHPGIDAATIHETLGLSSHPVAPGLGSYWRHRYDTHQDSECAAFVRDAALSLLTHSDFLQRIRAAGGRVEFFIGWEAKKNFGDTFSHETLAILARLQIDLAFDVYPDGE